MSRLADMTEACGQISWPDEDPVHSLNHRNFFQAGKSLNRLDLNQKAKLLGRSLGVASGSPESGRACQSRDAANPGGRINPCRNSLKGLHRILNEGDKQRLGPGVEKTLYQRSEEGRG